MKKAIFIEFVVVGSLIFGSCAFAYRASKPAQITLPLDDNKVTELNNALENLWNITNGRYSLDVVDTVPTTVGKEGDMKAYSSGGVYRIYIFLNDSWRAFTSD